ncbi:MAG: hypothetical protein JOZ49_05675, partial [Mycolicibacterium sp.]|nr:hypothetical protein [Mycolicibacterium sp.]
MTSKKAVLAELEGAHRSAARERAERERKNIGDVAEFAYQRAREDEVDEWVAIQTQRLAQEAAGRRDRHRAAAGNALRSIESRGATAKEIAALVDVPLMTVKEYLAVNGQEASPKSPRAKKRVAPALDSADTDSAGVTTPT